MLLHLADLVDQPPYKGRGHDAQEGNPGEHEACGDEPPLDRDRASHQKVPAVVIDRQAWTTALHDQLGGTWVLPETAAKLGWPVTLSFLEVTSPTGAISAATEAALNEHLDTENMTMWSAASRTTPG